MEEVDLGKLEEAVKKESAEEEKGKNGPLRYIIGLFLIFLIILMAIPYYGLKSDPRPEKIVSYSEVVPINLEVEKIEDHKIKNIRDFSKFVKINDSLIRQIAIRIVTSGCPNGGDVCNAKALYYFVRDEIKYVSDPLALEYAETSREVLKNKAADCDGHAILLATLSEAVGINARLVIVPNHMYIDVLLPDALGGYKIVDDWVALDPTCKNCDFGEIPYEYEGKERNYVGVS